MVTREHH